MNIQSAMVLAALLALAAFVVWRNVRKGVPCACGRSRKECGCGCTECSPKPH